MKITPKGYALRTRDATDVYIDQASIVAIKGTGKRARIVDPSVPGSVVYFMIDYTVPDHGSFTILTDGTLAWFWNERTPTIGEDYGMWSIYDSTFDIDDRWLLSKRQVEQLVNESM